MKLDVRAMTIDDAERVSELCIQLGYPATAQEAAGRINEVLLMQHQKAFVATDESVVIGWIYAFRTFSIESNAFIEIGGLIVDENYRGIGAGKLLIEKVKAWALTHNIHELRVRTNIRRIESHKFYTAIGFRKTKQQKVYNLPI
jgi:GNAT superfamily N-acetyltransferase